jgi:alkylated DNA repair dioxygenase AlkB
MPHPTEEKNKNIITLARQRSSPTGNRPPTDDDPLEPDFVYLPGVLDDATQRRHLEALLIETPWKTLYSNFYGKTFPMPRLMRLYGPVAYRYGRADWPPMPLTPRLEIVREQVEAACGWPFNSVLLNLYRTGADCINFHSDNLDGHGARPTIGVLSLGAARKLHVRRKRGPKTLHTFVLCCVPTLTPEA